MPRRLRISEPELINTAMRVFWRTGYRATTPKKLANELNVSVSTIYNKYGKEELFLQSLAHYIKGGPDYCIHTMHNSKEGLNAIRDIQYLMIEALTQGNQPDKCLVVNTIIELRDTLPNIKGIYLDFFKRFREAYEVALHRAYALGEIEYKEKIPAYVELIIGIQFALNILHKVNDKNDLIRYVDQQLALIK